jgi:ThiF family protein
MKTKLSMSGKQYHQMKEAVEENAQPAGIALLLCGSRAGSQKRRLVVREVHSMHTDDCVSISSTVEKTRMASDSIVVVSGPLDGVVAQTILCTAGGSREKNIVVGHAVLSSDGSMKGHILQEGDPQEEFHSISVAGDDIRFWFEGNENMHQVPGFLERTAQAFGNGTTELLHRLTVGVVGCSGTGSPVVEQLARSGVGELVLVDPDIVEEKNLNRILNSTRHDIGRYKVDVLSEAVERMGFGTKVETMSTSLDASGAIEAIGLCDVVFGGMDSIEGRHLLNRLSVFYSIPYIDIGIRLDADGRGGINKICGSVHYLQPGGSSLLSRGVYTAEELRAEGIRREDPEQYAQQLKEKYIVGAREEAPAVISVNMKYGADAVLELLARLHPFRVEDNGQFAWKCYDMSQEFLLKKPEGEPCDVLARHVGRGDVRPLLDMPSLSRREDAT